MIEDCRQRRHERGEVRAATGREAARANAAVLRLGEMPLLCCGSPVARPRARTECGGAASIRAATAVSVTSPTDASRCRSSATVNVAIERPCVYRLQCLAAAPPG